MIASIKDTPRMSGFASITRALATTAALLGGVFAAGSAQASGGEQAHIERQSWSFAGPFGTFDQAQLRRGFQVYSQVCAACHPMNLVYYRNLSELGFTEAEIKALAAQATVKDGTLDGDGKLKERPGRASDHFPSPWVTEESAREMHNGAVPPDFSMLAKARTYSRGFPWFLTDAITQYTEHGPDYIVALLTGYEENPPHGVTVLPGQYYNKVMPGNVLSMAPPLSDGAVDYQDATVPKTTLQYSKDVTAFMTWASEPTMEKRKRTGLMVMIYLAVLTALLAMTKKKVWRKVYGH